jgi:hypothetical protein
LGGLIVLLGIFRVCLFVPNSLFVGILVLIVSVILSILVSGALIIAIVGIVVEIEFVILHDITS